MNNTSADVIVIGSGFGGAVAADRLVRAGLNVRVLERGPWRRTAPVLAKGLNHAIPLPVQDRPGLILRTIRSVKGPKEICLNRRGLLEMHVGNGVKTLGSSAVGGGSHLWSALVARPDDMKYWNERAEGVSEALMAPHYTQVAEELGAVRPLQVESLPNHTSHAWRDSGWFETVAEADQYPFAFLFPEQNGGRATAGRELSQLNGEDGLFGSPRAAKANVETTYLLPHLDAGLTVHDMVEVLTIAPSRSGSYEVIAKDHGNGEVRSYRAPRVVLAAGTLNSIKILYASQESGKLQPMARLGQGFGTNGDCLGSWRPNIDPCNSRLGSPIHGRLKTRDHPQDVNLIIGGLDAMPLPRWMPSRAKTWMAEKAQRQFQLIAMGVDRANGSVSFTQNRLKLDYDLNDSEVYRTIFDMLDNLSDVSGARIKFERKAAMTAHAMGGCRIGSSADEGVVDGEGQVFGNPGLYVADASVLPAPTGGPPSLTIAAWSSHLASSLVSNF
ncbi:MAG: GMC oxidoreductase [Candidatus Thiodiazotropha sp.]